MELGIIGLGRMGANIGRRVMRAGHRVVGFDANAGAVKARRARRKGPVRWKSWCRSCNRPARSG